MSSALAIAGVTAVLRDLLNDGLINHNVSGLLGSTVTVSAVPPDRVVPANGAESTQLNLFLHQVTFNTGWRNHALPSRDGSGTQRLSNPPLALDLHYLVSAYSAEELGSEILLGYAMQLLHETPVLDRKAITTALNPSPSVETTLPPALRALAECGLADQVEQIKLVPDPLSTEEMSKLWTAVQSHYRPTAAYVATVVLIESSKPTKPTLPVLTRGPVDPVTKLERGVVVQADLLPPFPTIQTSPQRYQSHRGVFECSIRHRARGGGLGRRLGLAAPGGRAAVVGRRFLPGGCATRSSDGDRAPDQQPARADCRPSHHDRASPDGAQGWKRQGDHHAGLCAGRSSRTIGLPLARKPRGLA